MHMNVGSTSQVLFGNREIHFKHSFTAKLYLGFLIPLIINILVDLMIKFVKPNKNKIQPWMVVAMLCPARPVGKPGEEP